METKPILVYLYNGHDAEDRNAKFARSVESKTFGDKRVILAARSFTCEKICFGCKELGQHVPHRAVVESYTRTLKRVDAESDSATGDATNRATARIVLLDSDGMVIRKFLKPPSAPVLAAAMKQAAKENALRVKLGSDGDLSG